MGIDLLCLDTRSCCVSDVLGALAPPAIPALPQPGEVQPGLRKRWNCWTAVVSWWLILNLNSIRERSSFITSTTSLHPCFTSTKTSTITPSWQVTIHIHNTTTPTHPHTRPELPRREIIKSAEREFRGRDHGFRSGMSPEPRLRQQHAAAESMMYKVEIKLDARSGRTSGMSRKPNNNLSQNSLSQNGYGVLIHSFVSGVLIHSFVSDPTASKALSQAAEDDAPPSADAAPVCGVRCCCSGFRCRFFWCS